MQTISILVSFLSLQASDLIDGGVLLLGGMSESRVLPKTVASVFDYMRDVQLFLHSIERSIRI